MSELHSVVCMKVVPKPEEIRVDPKTHMLERADARSEINPPDMNALEMALGLKDLHGGRVSILSMGPPLFDPLLRVGVAMGADHVYLLSDRAFAGADTLATTYTLAQGINKISDANLIFCGEESSDGATGQVPAGLAEWLDVCQLSLLTNINVDLKQGIAQGTRELKGGYEIVKVPTPCVVSVKTACNEPRFMDFEIKPWAFEKERLTVWDAASVEADQDFIGLAGSPTIVSGLDQAPSQDRKRQFLDGSPKEITKELSRILEDIL